MLVQLTFMSNIHFETEFICCVQNNYKCFFHGGVPRGCHACHAGDAGSSVAVAVALSSY